MKFPLYIENFGWRIGCRIQNRCRINPTFSVFFISFPLLFWPQSRAFSCQMQQETVGLFDVSSDIILPVPFFHYHDERRRLRNFVDANTTWILAMAKCCDLLKFLYLCWCSYNRAHGSAGGPKLWFAEIFVPLLVQLQPAIIRAFPVSVVICWNFCTFAGAVTTWKVRRLWTLRCDLLKFLYLCWCSYNRHGFIIFGSDVVICWNFCTFAGAVTTIHIFDVLVHLLWFAEIFVPLLVQLQHTFALISPYAVVICWNFCTFAGAVTTRGRIVHLIKHVVICWNFCTFAGAVTTLPMVVYPFVALWFAEIFVTLLVQLQRIR